MDKADKADKAEKYRRWAAQVGMLDLSALLSELIELRELRRQAEERGEEPGLEELLDSVPEHAVRLDCTIRFTDELAEAHWREREGRGLSVALGDTMEAAIRAATRKLLGAGK
jgi:hypothetical protein